MRVSKRLADDLDRLGRVTPTRPAALTGAAPAAGWAIELTIPCRVVSEANCRDHWAVKRRRRCDQDAAFRLAVCGAGLGDFRPRTPCVVTFTRFGPRPMDSDNLAGAFKALRDSVARWFGVDDGDESLVAWAYRQEAGPAGVRVRIESRA